jgi:hypothetical protein
VVTTQVKEKGTLPRASTPAVCFADAQVLWPEKHKPLKDAEGGWLTELRARERMEATLMQRRNVSAFEAKSKGKTSAPNIQSPLIKNSPRARMLAVKVNHTLDFKQGRTRHDNARC